MLARVGIDLVSVDSVQDSLDTHGEHYLKRVYTERELERITAAAAEPSAAAH